MLNSTKYRDSPTYDKFKSIYNTYSLRKMSTFESGQYCLAVNETLLSAFCGHYCPDA